MTGDELLIGLRNVLLLQLGFSMAVFLPPGGSLDILRAFLKKWESYRRRLLKRNKQAGTSSGKFWEIDMTKFEP